MKIAKPVSYLSFLSLSLSLCAQAQPSTDGSRPEESFHVTERGDHHRVWSKVRYETSPLGELEPRTNSYVELTTGLHFRDPVSKDWVESDPSFEVSQEGFAAARRCQHQVIISPNLNSPDGVVVDVLTADGLRLRSGIAGLNLFDPVSGKSQQIGAVRDVIGTQVSSNEVVWLNAFEGLEADVRVRNERGQFHQDVLLREKLSAKQLTALGFDADTVRLEVWTEFVNAPEPVTQRIVLKTETNAVLRATMADPDEVDHVLKFGGEMQIGPGSAFIEDEPAKATRVFKQWHRIGDRRFLIEAIPYRELLPLLEALPVKSAYLGIGNSTSNLAASRIPPQRAKASANGVTKTAMIASLDNASALPSGPRVVLDYPLSGTYTDYTLRGDTTYYISGFVNLTGTSKIEGGTVIKFAPYNPGVYLQFNGAVDCKTGPYRTAIFTARDDNTVGEVISGSTGTPSGYYASTALYGPSWPTGDLHNLVIRHAMHAITWYYASSRLSDLQLVNCYYGIGRTYNIAPVHNVLLNNVIQAFWGYAVNYDLEHVTVNQCTELASVYGSYSPGYINLTNCVLANVSSWGSYNQLNADYNGRYNTPPLSQVHDFPVSASPFEPPVGAGSHYLAASSNLRDEGTLLIHADLQNALKTKTTFAPTIVGSSITTPTTWQPLVARDSDQPDLGYHYDPLDWVVSAKNVSAQLTLSDGVAVGTYGSGSSYGLGIASAGSLVSAGTPANLNWIVRYNMVQEQTSTSWASSSVGSSVKLLSGTPAVTATYTGWSLPANLGDHFNNTVSGAAASSFTHCQFSGGKLTIDPGSVDLKNCLWQRVYVTLRDMNYDPVWTLYNNLFYGGTLYYRATGDNPTMVAKDNFFDRTGITRGSSSEYFTHNNNGYITGQNRLLPIPVPPDDVVIPTMVYAPGPRGNFYQAQTDLRNEGSRTADAAQLTEFTSLTDYQPDAGMVDIGFHYYLGSAPTANPGAAQTCRNQWVGIMLSGSDPDGDPLAYTVVTGPTLGTLSPPSGSPGQYRIYTPNPGQCGQDSFQFKVSDGLQDSTPATVTVDVGNPNPIADCRDVICPKGQSVTFQLSGSDPLCNEPLRFAIGDPPSEGGAVQVISQDPPDHATVTFTPRDSSFGERDFFNFTVSSCGFVSPQPGQVTVYVVSPPLLITSCREDRIVLHWSIPEWIASLQVIDGFRIYRCDTTPPGQCTPSGTPIATITDPDARSYEDTDPGLQQGRTYCYRVNFFMADSCDPLVDRESPFSNTSCSQLCSPPALLVVGNNASTVSGPGPIQTYEFATGSRLASFLPEHAGNGRGLAVRGTEMFYTERFDYSIHVCPWPGDVTDIRTLQNTWRPNVEIQDLAFHGDGLYILTGYPNQELQIFKLNPSTGAVLGGPITIAGPASSDSDGFTVLPNGNFLINDFDGAIGPCPYREYNGTTGELIPPPGGLEIDLTEFGFSIGTGVAVAPDGQSLCFVAHNLYFTFSTLVQTDLAGNLLGFQGIGYTQFEDIDAVAP